MEILEVDYKLYQDQLSCFSIFNSVKFIELNKLKVDQVFYLIFKDTKVRLGIALGCRGFDLYSPFSAPYGGFIYNNDDCKAKIVDVAIGLLDDWIVKKGFRKLYIGLPAMHYNPTFISRIVNGLHNYNYKVDNYDVNHHFQIPDKFGDSYISKLPSNARNKLKNAFKENLKFHKVNQHEAKRAYDIIVINRLYKHKPLRLTLEQILEVSTITKIDFFVVEKNENDVASAIVFGINKEIVQVVYWGDNPQYVELKAMNFLAFKIFEYYAENGIKTIEIGISTENSIPNYGLCEFKESIGCSLSLKYSFSKSF